MAWLRGYLAGIEPRQCWSNSSCQLGLASASDGRKVEEQLQENQPLGMCVQAVVAGGCDLDLTLSPSAVHCCLAKIISVFQL